jgi:PAS domain-containing protein
MSSNTPTHHRRWNLLSRIVALDANRRVQMCNPAFERLFGYAQAEILGASLETVFAVPGRESETAGLVGTVEHDGSADGRRMTETWRHRFLTSISEGLSHGYLRGAAADFIPSRNSPIIRLPLS